MSKPTSYAEIRRLVFKAMENDKSFMSDTEDDKEHPQVADMRNTVKGRMQAWEAILDAAKGEPALLRLHAEGF
jgi:hypothetical protein